MENKREFRGQKFKPYDDVGSPMMNLAGPRRRWTMFDPYASDSSDSPSPLMKYLRSVDPATPGASSPAFITPIKVEEDVIVMDGISVPKSNKGIAEVRTRLPLMSSNSVNSSFGKSNSTLSSSSLGSGGRRSGGENIKIFKKKLCHFWETSGICQFGSECQFAHGKEELRHHRFTAKIKHEISKLSSSSEGSSPLSYGSKIRPNSQLKAAAAAAGEGAFSMPSTPTAMAFSASPITPKQLSESIISYWTPQIDGIEVSLRSHSTVQKNPSKEDVDAYIDKVLYGTNARKRLPIFVEICPDS